MKKATPEARLKPGGGVVGVRGPLGLGPLLRIHLCWEAKDVVLSDASGTGKMRMAGFSHLLKRNPSPPEFKHSWGPGGRSTLRFRELVSLAVGERGSRIIDFKSFFFIR